MIFIVSTLFSRNMPLFPPLRRFFLNKWRYCYNKLLLVDAPPLSIEFLKSISPFSVGHAGTPLKVIALSAPSPTANLKSQSVSTSTDCLVHLDLASPDTASVELSKLNFKQSKAVLENGLLPNIYVDQLLNNLLFNSWPTVSGQLGSMTAMELSANRKLISPVVAMENLPEPPTSSLTGFPASCWEGFPEKSFSSEVATPFLRVSNLLAGLYER